MPIKPSNLLIDKLKSPVKPSLSPAISSLKLTSPQVTIEDPTHDIIILSPELDARIAKVLQENTEEPKFNAILRINELFPTEESILGADFVMESLTAQIVGLDAELRLLVQSKSSEKDTKDLILSIKSAIKVFESFKNSRFWLRKYIQSS